MPNLHSMKITKDVLRQKIKDIVYHDSDTEKLMMLFTNLRHQDLSEMEEMIEGMRKNDWGIVGWDTQVGYNQALNDLKSKLTQLVKEDK